MAWPVRVYYEDTDAAGVVYYANYLRFCERARTEWLRALDIQQKKLFSEQAIAFVVTHVDAKYLKGAELDDELVVLSSINSIGAASIAFEQEIRRAGSLLFSAKIKVACVDWKQHRAVRLPDDLRKLIESQA